MRRTAPRHGRCRVAVHRVGGLLGAVIGDDRRTIVVAAEIEARTGILPHIGLVGETSDLAPRALTCGPEILDILWHCAAAADFGFCMRHGKARHLARDWPAFG